MLVLAELRRSVPTFHSLPFGFYLTSAALADFKYILELTDSICLLTLQKIDYIICRGPWHGGGPAWSVDLSS